MLIDQKLWQPADNLELEAAALETVKSDFNTLVVAGPGAGKTELLAQRACYLLQTNTTKFPKKILAISFKRDAAINLRNRVKTRCGDILSRRFESLTFDSFSRQLVNRFKSALPKKYKINGELTIISSKELLEIIKFNHLAYYNSNNRNYIEKLITDTSLPFNITNQHDQIKDEVWTNLLDRENSLLTFPMIMRLAQLIITANPKIKHFLQATYSHVFLDEFQDTTSIQYNFFRSCFDTSDARITAVGDDKQRIMLWAGAKPEIFENFLVDVKAKPLSLTMNFRSAPRLVALQNYLIKHLLKKDDLVVPSNNWKEDEGEAYVWVYNSPEEETVSLYNSVAEWLRDGNQQPRDICILVKQRLNVYTEEIIKFFNDNGIKARDESAYEELLSEDLIVFLTDVLYLIFTKRASSHKSNAFRFLSNIYSDLEDSQLLKLDNNFSSFVKNAKDKVSGVSISKEHFNTLLTDILSFTNVARIKAFYPEYKNTAYFNGLIAKFVSILYRDDVVINDVVISLNNFIGEDAIPVMTVHKSKGLEYRTVIFVGLEDDAFWSFKSQPDEDMCTFFVALSRAKEKVVFTFSKKRKNQYGQLKPQSIENIKVILEEMEKSGIVKMEAK